MKKVTALLLVYAILVIASSIFWVWSALSKSSFISGNDRGSIKIATRPDKMKQDAELVTNKATELTGGVTDDIKADGHRTDLMGNDLESLL